MFPCSLSDQELFTGQFGGLDSGFNSVDSGSKRWSGNEVQLLDTRTRTQSFIHNTNTILCSLSVTNRPKINDSVTTCLCVQSADDFSERSLRMAEVSRDQRNLEEEEEEEEEQERSPLEAKKGEEGHICSVFHVKKKT